MGGVIDVAVIGAGPYGLSLAAHLRSRAVDFRIFGTPMSAWKDNMPRGMLLKSYPWASCLSDPESQFTVKQFCTGHGIPYHDSLVPLPAETFVAYGEAFQQRFVPEVEPKHLVSIEPVASGLALRFDDGDAVSARRVIVAVGLAAFRHIPAVADGMPPELVSHSADYGPVDGLEGKDVAVIGGGSSATDLAALLHEAGSSVTVVARTDELRFASMPQPRGLVEKAIAPTNGIGTGWRMYVCATLPSVVHFLPEAHRVRAAHSPALGPLGGAFMRDRVIGKASIRLGSTLRQMRATGSKAEITVASADGTGETLRFDHVVFATGYRVDVDRLGFLSPEMAAGIRRTGSAPRLSYHYEASIPGLHFIGPAAAVSFGPVCRFVFGSFHPARHLASYLPNVLRRGVTSVGHGELADSPVPS